MASALYVHAAALEAEGVASELPVCLELGVGKAAAAASLSRALSLAPRLPDVVVGFGVGGWTPARLASAALPVDLGVGDVCMVASERFGDEGVAVEEGGFLEMSSLGLGIAPPGVAAAPWACDAGRGSGLATALALPSVAGLTVSTCSGSDALAQARYARYGPAVESMEGAAIAMTCAFFGVPWVMLRAVSNYTGDRSQGKWDLETAVTSLHATLRRVQASLAADTAVL